MTQPALHLDFVRPPPAPGRVWGWVLLGLAVLAVFELVDAHTAAIDRRDALQARVDRLSRRTSLATARRPERAPDAPALAEMQRANSTIEALAVPWGELFHALEAADARGLAVLSLTPNARERSLRLAGEAKGMDELLGYVSRLAAQPSLTQVHLVAYNTVTREGVALFAFTLAAQWRPTP